jgi:ABC-type transport system involved in multi-copper enzyme maturation permease subunit
MIRIVQAELQRLLRRRTIVVAALASVAFAVVATLAVFAAARDSGPPPPRGGTTIAHLATAAGGTEAFALGASFVGFLVFVVFIALIATEFSAGTLRALLLRDPSRVRMIAGKVVGALTVAAAALLLAEALSFALSLAIAPSKGIDSGPWFSIAGLGHAVGNYATVLAGVAGWAVFGTTLAVIFRSAPIALAVGFAWAGPFENIVVDSWTTGYRVFPGQVLAAVIQGGRPEISLSRAVVTGLVYVGIAAATTTTLLVRRDVTS